MGFIEMLIVLIIVIMLLQLLFSFIPGIDRRIVGVVLLLVVLYFLFGRGMHLRFR